MTLIILRDKRFNVKLQKSKGNFDYGDLRALAQLLEIVINTSLCDMGRAPKEFNMAIDNLARQVFNVFNSIQDIGASHVRRMLAKEALGVLHNRLKYAVRSSPPPKKTLFPTLEKERDGNITSHFKARTTVNGNDDQSRNNAQATDIPIRGHSQAS